MSWATVDDVVAGLVAGQSRAITYPSITSVNGRLTNLNIGSTTGRWGQMATPATAGSSGTLHAQGDVGFPPITNAAGGNTLRLALACLGMQSSGQVTIYERIWSCSGLSGTLNTAQNITSFPSLTIPDSVGTGLEMFAEIYTAIGATPTTVTASYTNSGNTSGRTTIAASIGNTGLREIARLIPMPLQVGDTGVKSIASATLAASTGTVGDWGLVLAKRLCTLNSPGLSGMVPHDFARLGLPLVDNGAALMFACLASTTSTGVIDGMIVIGEK